MKRVVILLLTLLVGWVWIIAERDRKRSDRSVIPPLGMYYKSHHWITAPINRYIAKHSDVRDDAFPDMQANFPNHILFKSHWRRIRNEVLRIYQNEGMSEIKGDLFFRKIADKNWKKFYIKWYDTPLPDAAVKMPFTTNLIQACPEIQCAMISVLEPGAVIKAHVGPFRGALRYHLGLKTPQQSSGCFIKVDGCEYSWRDGEDVLFDDTYVHEVKNETDEPRFILFMDVQRNLDTRFSNKILSAACKIAKITSQNRKN